MEPFLVVLGALAAVGVTAWTYYRREAPVRGRGLLAGLRAVALLLLVLLLWNPTVPLVGGGEGGRAPRVLLDASLSMSAAGSGADPSSGGAWAAALERAGELAGSADPVLLFGSSVRVAPLDSVSRLRPGDAASSLAPALERAAALGARSVRVVSDFRLDDPAAVAAVLEETGLAVGFEDVGGGVRNVGIAGLDAPATLDAGEEGSVEVLLEGDPGEGGGADSVALELRAEGRLLAARRVSFPPRGGGERHVLAFTAPDDRGAHRIEISADLSGDGFPADDRRVTYMDVDPSRAGLLLLSMAPDWEPRYLLPVLEQVTGLDARGYLLLTGERWLPLGLPEAGAGPADGQEVREAAEEAGFVVLHGLGSEPPAWIRELAESADRLLAYPEGPGALGLFGLASPGWSTGEWYAVPELPASPLAGDLAGASFQGLPPLTALLETSDPVPRERAPLMLRRGRRGLPSPALVLVTDGERRAAVALASGFWRWAARDGAPREAYRRLWSAAAGWLMESPTRGTGPAVEPLGRPLARGHPVEWRVRGDVGDTLEVVLRTAPGDSVVLDTTVARAGSRARTPALPPGRYQYRIGAAGLDGDVTGELEVSPYSDELLRARVQPPGVSGEAEGEGVGVAAGRPLRTHPAPYLVILGLLSAEWIGRRRQGLR